MQMRAIDQRHGESSVLKGGVGREGGWEGGRRVSANQLKVKTAERSDADAETVV